MITALPYTAVDELYALSAQLTQEFPPAPSDTVMMIVGGFADELSRTSWDEEALQAVERLARSRLIEARALGVL